MSLPIKPRWLLLFFGLLCVSSVYAESLVNSAVNKLPAGSRYALMVEDTVSKQTTLELNTHLYYPLQAHKKS